MNFKKIIAFTTALLLCSVSCITPQVVDNISSSMVANAADIISGSCGNTCTYSFDSSTGTFTISGTGLMDNVERYRYQFKR